MQILSFCAFAMTSAVAYPGWKGVVMRTLQAAASAAESAGKRRRNHMWGGQKKYSLSVDDVLLELRVNTLLVVGHDEVDVSSLAP